MRIPWILTIALVAAAVPAGAQQKYNKPHENKGKSGAAVKAPTQRNSNSLQLQKLEQQTAKSAVGTKSSGRAHVAAVRTQRERANPPIHFASGTGAHESGSGSANSSKSRVRTKGKR